MAANPSPVSAAARGAALRRALTTRPLATLFVVGLLVRAMGWLATPDRDSPFDATYQGDAPYWLEQAAGRGGLESLLPFRPPAMAWLTRWLADSDGGASNLRLLMLVLGAAIAPLLFRAVRDRANERAAWIAGLLCVASQPLLQLGSGVHSELPYLLLFLLSFDDHLRLLRGASPAIAARWSAAQALACLFRADHFLYWLLATATWARRPGRRIANLSAAALAFAVVIAPWQWHVASSIAMYNERGVGVVADAPMRGSLPWDPDAIAAVTAMPAFARNATFGFVDATVRARRGDRVRRADLQVLEEAYGSTPRALGTPWLALYGPLNFFLGNSPESDGGFTRAPLDRPPLLRGGDDRYPPGLRRVLPTELALDYPPHLAAVVDGYRLGLDWIASEPLRAARLVGLKLAQTWRGAAGGFGTLALPIGRSGVREPVDITVAEGPFASTWRLLMLALAIAGWWRIRRTDIAWILTIWIATRIAIAAAFFGYARLGALCIPALAWFWAVGSDPLLLRLEHRWRRALAIAVLASLLLAEGLAAVESRPPMVDGVPFSDAKPVVHGRARISW